MEPIDIVYLWCDGSENRFKADKEKYSTQENVAFDEESVGEMRFSDNDELKYSLRSLEKNASWINHVFIVTDRQCPKWLNCAYNKVTIIDHSQILPTKDIPTFNSLAIEYRIHLIPGLSEKFLYANDDMFFGQKVEPEFFFCADRPIVRVLSYANIKKIESLEQFEDFLIREPSWMQTNLHAWRLLNAYYQQKDFYVLHHNVDAYTKADFTYILNNYATELEHTLHSRFRNENRVARSIIGLASVYRGTAILKVVKKMNFRQKHLYWKKTDHCYSYSGSENKKTVKYLRRFSPFLFCLNASNNSTKETKLKIKNFMQEIFSLPSKFEK